MTISGLENMRVDLPRATEKDLCLENKTEASTFLVGYDLSCSKIIFCP
jgi:hypothetical protein